MTHTEYFNRCVTASLFNEFIAEELAHIPVPEKAGLPKSIFVCGRYGAGKSTFADNWLGHKSFFEGATYHIDSDRIMKDLYERGLTASRGDTNLFQAVQRQLLECLTALNANFTYSFAGKETLSPMVYHLPKASPIRENLGTKKRAMEKPYGHMVLCEQDVALERVRARQAAGGHPYQELVGNFEDKYRFKQAQIIYGLPLYADGVTDTYYIWDASTSGEMSLVVSIDMTQEGRVITTHDDIRAAKFGLHEAPLKALFTLYDRYEFVYNYVLGHVIDQHFDADLEKIFRRTSDRLDINFMNEILKDEPERQSILKSALRAESEIVFVDGTPQIIKPLEKQNFLLPENRYPASASVINPAP